jgi:hypothetical protein
MVVLTIGVARMLMPRTPNSPKQVQGEGVEVSGDGLGAASAADPAVLVWRGGLERDGEVRHGGWTAADGCVPLPSRSVEVVVREAGEHRSAAAVDKLLVRQPVQGRCQVRTNFPVSCRKKSSRSSSVASPRLPVATAK